MMMKGVSWTNNRRKSEGFIFSNGSSGFHKDGHRVRDPAGEKSGWRNCVRHRLWTVKHILFEKIENNFNTEQPPFLNLNLETSLPEKIN
jgi:hypothetical protein